MKQSKKKIDAIFTDMYNAMEKKVNASGRGHYFQLKKTSKGIKIGDVQITRNKGGYVLKRGYHRGYSVIEKNVNTKKAAIMLAVFHIRGDQVKFKDVLDNDTKYGSAVEKLLISKERMRHYADEGDWFKVDLIESRLGTYMNNAHEAQDNLKQLYYNCVF